MFLWIIILGILVYYLLNNNVGFNNVNETPKETLKKRLAKGEITIEEYQKILKTYKEE